MTQNVLNFIDFIDFKYKFKLIIFGKIYYSFKTTLNIHHRVISI
jgi:hypothetical protein